MNYKKKYKKRIGYIAYIAIGTCSSLLMSDDSSRLISVETKIDAVVNDLQKIKNELISMNRSHETALDNILKHVTGLAISVNKITGQKEPVLASSVLMAPTSNITPQLLQPIATLKPAMPIK
ncbi:MAG: hypothetical protein WC707_05505 [Candidatus Babeliaceae bacterium]|jgi:hypothetical protein